MKIFKRMLIGLVIVTVLLFVAVRLAINPLVTKVIPPVASQQIGADLSINDFSLSILGGRLGVGSLLISQPEGFGSAPLLDMQNFKLNLGTWKLLGKKVMVDNFSIDRLALNVVRNEAGLTNLEALAPTNQAPVAAVETNETVETATPPAVIVKQVDIQNLSIAFLDQSVDPPINLSITNGSIQVQNIQFDPANASEAPEELIGTILVTALLQQPGFTNGHLGVTARTGVIGMGVPPLNAAVRLSGFEIQTLAGLLPPGVTAPLGGSSVDLGVDASVATNLLDITLNVSTEGNNLSQRIGGTPDNPKLDATSTMFNLISSPAALLTGTASDITGAGIAAGKATIDVAAGAGMNVAQGIGNLGKGLFDTTKSLAQGDIVEAGKNLTGTAGGVIQDSVGTVTGAAQDTVDGLGDTAHSAIGGERSGNWREETLQRWETGWEEAKNFVANAPYPKPAE